MRILVQGVDLQQQIADGDHLLVIALCDEDILLAFQRLNVARLVVQHTIVRSDGIVVKADLAERGGLLHEDPLVARVQSQDLIGHGDHLLVLPLAFQGGHL